jgi:hypothetical protein
MELCKTSTSLPEFMPSASHMPLSASYVDTTMLDFPWASDPNQTDCFFSFSQEANFETACYNRHIEGKPQFSNSTINSRPVLNTSLQRGAVDESVLDEFFLLLVGWD